MKTLTNAVMSPDGREQTTVFTTGGRATVNFGDNTYRLEGDGFRVEGRVED